MKKYNIGLDIGTTSVGWAVINSEDFKVMRKGNKAMWGVRIFDTATSAEKRRIFRSTRRKYDRRRKRIKLLQAEFSDEIRKIDVNFYEKLKDSFYKQDDLENKKFPLTDEEKQKIVEYNIKYPTIYHLRKALMDSSKKEDIRLIYLALHHIIKYRGNFLLETDDLKISNLSIKEKLEEVFDIITENSNINIDEEDVARLDLEKIENAFTETTKNDKKRIIEQELAKGLEKNISKEFSKLLVGDKFSLNKLLGTDVEEDVNLSFKGADYDDEEVHSKIEKNYSEQLEIIESLKELFDIITLKSLFKGSKKEYLSELMVERYETHKEDLKNLKEMYRSSLIPRTSFLKMFKTMDPKNPCLYDLYIHNKKTYDEFTKQIISDYNKIEVSLSEKEQIKYEENIIQKIAAEKFMPRITDTDNGKFPYQLNKNELIKIIENQGKYYPFLLNETNDGTKKIVKLLEFRIPYYVGPLNNTTKDKNITNKNAWLIRKKEKIAITPYNFEEVVDIENSAEEFITRMIGQCTYILNEKAIPRNSILYSKFKVLNELKQIKVGDKGKEENLSLQMQKEIYENFFLKENGTLTDRKFKKYSLNPRL